MTIEFDGMTNEGAVVEIGGTGAHADAAAYEGDTYTSVGIVDQLPEHGSTSTVVTAQPLNTDEVARKGTRTFPETTMPLYHVPGDAGLAALEAAEQSRSPYAFRIEWPDAVTPTTGHGTRHYFRALVTGLTYPAAGANDFSMVTVAMKMVTVITKVAAT